MTTAFTVVIPLHNKGRHVARALDSVRAQTHPPAEIVVVDDASTDDGPTIAASYPGIRLLRRESPGAGGYAARNLAIEAATSSWIAFLDADDAWTPDHLATCANMINGASNSLVLSGSGYAERHPGDVVVTDVYSRLHSGAVPTSFDFDSFVALWLKIGECPVWTSSIVARRDALLTVGGFPADRCRRGGDKDLWLRLAHVGEVRIGTRRTATYFKDSDNMVTQRRHVNECHCVTATIDQWTRIAAPPRRRLLERLRNHETFAYALRTAKTDRVRYASWRGFHVRRDPAQFALLAILTTPLGPLIGRVASRFRRRSRPA